MDTNETGRGQRLYERARTMIPGGTQLLSKRPELFLPGRWPAYYQRARGVEVWDLDGRRYVDMSYSAVGSCILGYADPDVDAAVQGAIQNGSMCTLNCPEEVELADLLLERHPWANRVRYARTGGESMAIAVRLARAATGRDVIAFCGYHGWHDWYLAANLPEDALGGHLLAGLSPVGVPRGLAGTALPFTYNQTEELEAIVAAHGSRLAAVVMEPVRSVEPEDGFLERVATLTRGCGAVLVLDEITAGFRLTQGGAHLRYGITPDVAVFAKGMSNGYPMAAVIGTDSVLEAAQLSFISSTYWTERIGPTAALATMRKMEAIDAPSRLAEAGELVTACWREAAQRHGLKIEVKGLAPIRSFSFADEQHNLLKTLYTKEMLERGYLASTAFYATTAHGEEALAGYAKATDEAFSVLAGALAKGDLEASLAGPPAQVGFQRLA